MTSLEGQTLGRYQVVTSLGLGGMGEVYQGRDLTLQRDVAIKVMHPHIARDPGFAERFLQEARAAANLSHPGIVQVHDFGQAGERLFIVMEFIKGDNLRVYLADLSQEEQWIELGEVVGLVGQVCLAVDYAHRRGVLHRDIKPANIMLGDEPSDGLPFRPVLTDLGLAKLQHGGLQTREGTSMGTPAYMSPEQALAQEVDLRSDVYSLGVLLYELAVGRLPFPIGTLTEAIRHHTQDPEAQPPQPREFRPSLPHSVEDAILRALRRDPAERFADAQTMSKVLSGLRREATQVVTDKTELEGSVSLMTVYQESLVKPRGSSLLDEFPAVPEDLKRDRIQVRAPDGSIRAVQIKPGGMVVGREGYSDLSLEFRNVSRRHARIDFDGSDYRVTDLDSTNGTFLGNLKLLPGLPHTWDPNQPLRVGQVWLRLERGQPLPETLMYRTDGTVVDPVEIQSSAGEGLVAAFMQTPELSVDPGGTAVGTLTVLNRAEAPDQFGVQVLGVPPEWVRTPSDERLMPGVQKDLQFELSPPRSPQSRAGAYRLRFLIASRADSEQVAELEAVLRVTPYQQFSAELKPKQIKAGTSAAVLLHNQSNAGDLFRLEWDDPADELGFEPQEREITLEEGAQVKVVYRARPKARRLFGRAKTYPFRISVAPAAGAPALRDGELIARPMLPGWALGALIPIAMLFCAGGAFAASLYDGDGDGLTDVRELMLGTDRVVVDTDRDELGDGEEGEYGTDPLLADTDGDTLFDGLEIHQLGTDPLQSDTDGDGLGDAVELLELGTDPLQADSDGDGISDAEEARAGTGPLAQDSDGDGLSDGEEVDQWGTDPLNPDTDGDGLGDSEEIAHGSDPLVTDTDGDTLSDGEEVNQLGTSPVNADSDGDGLNDNVDPAPGELPTGTPEPSATAVPTSTSLPTSTSAPTAVPPTAVPPTAVPPSNTPPPTATPTKVPVTYSTGLLSIPQTWMADLDEGSVGVGGASDIWFEAVSATERFITPRSGAKIAVVGTTSVGLYGCIAAPLSSSRIHVNSTPQGTYICVLTNAGRYSQFRVNAPIGPSPGTLEIGYTTWE